jgi:hypothetical protein
MTWGVPLGNSVLPTPAVTGLPPASQEAALGARLAGIIGPGRDGDGDHPQARVARAELGRASGIVRQVPGA